MQMTPEEELAVMVPGFEYKGVSFSLPRPVVDYIAELMEDRARALRSVDGLHAQLVAQLIGANVGTEVSASQQAEAAWMARRSGKWERV